MPVNPWEHQAKQTNGDNTKKENVPPWAEVTPICRKEHKTGDTRAHPKPVEKLTLNKRSKSGKPKSGKERG
jgi:hypothetical protein